MTAGERNAPTAEEGRRKEGRGINALKDNKGKEEEVAGREEKVMKEVFDARGRMLQVPLE